MSIVISGFPSTDKVPGAYGEVIFGAGALSAADIPLTLLLSGLMTTGTATPDVTIVPIFSGNDGVNAFGARSQLRRMIDKALLTAGITIYAMAVSEAGGAVAATLTCTVAGSWSANGTYSFRLGGESYSITVGASQTVTQVAASIVAATNGNTAGFCTAAQAAGVVTFTCANKGTDGNQYIAFGDTSLAPSGSTFTLAGGTGVTGGGVPFSGGTGTESVTTALAALFATKFDRIGTGQNDASNLALWKTQLGLQAGVLEGRRQHLICAQNSTLANAQSLAQTTLNDARFQVMWQLNGENHPSETAASFASARTVNEQVDPDHAYDSFVIPGIVPNLQPADSPSHSTLVSALNTGVTPVTSTKSQALISRSIVTRSLNGSSPDYRTLDTSDAVVPDYVLTDLLLRWSTQYAPANPRVRDNPAPEEPNPPDGVATPDTWNTLVTARLRAFERGDGLPAPILSNVSDNLPISNFDSVAKRIMSAVVVVPAANQHQIGISVRQHAN